MFSTCNTCDQQQDADGGEMFPRFNFPRKQFTWTPAFRILQLNTSKHTLTAADGRQRGGEGDSELATHTHSH